MRHAAVASSFLCLAATSLLTGCPDRSISEVLPQQGRVEFKDIPVNVNRDVDILFVIDDSPSMADKQANLATNFPNFINVLKTIPGGLPNVQIGVVTSDLGSKGADDPAPGPGTGTGKGSCSGLGKDGNLQTFGAPVNGGPYIRDVQDITTGNRQTNYTGTLEGTFSQMAKGASALGCGFEQHLEAMRQALDGNPTNNGFLRPDAFLAVIFIADEDDCSMSHSSLIAMGDTGPLGPLQSFRCTRFGVLCDNGGSTTNAMNQIGTKTQCHPNDSSAYLTKVNDYVAFLKGLKSDPKKVIVAGIMGTTDRFEVELRSPTQNGTQIPALAHSCTYVGGDGKPEVADPPIRIKFFLDQFPNRSTFATICQRDLSGGLQQVGDLLKTVIGDPCIEGKLADVIPATPQLDYDCAVSSVLNPGTAQQQEKIMPRCTPENAMATNQPCWHLVPDPMNCKVNDPTSLHLSLKIEGKDMLAKDTHIIANCVTEVTNN